MHLPFLFAGHVIVSSQLEGGGAGNTALTGNQSFPLFYWNENPSYKGPHSQSIYPWPFKTADKDKVALLQ